MKKLFFLLFLGACSYFHTKGSLEKEKPASVATTGVNLGSKGDAKLYTFNNKDLLKVSTAFVNVLQKAGFTITYQDLYSGKIGAEMVSKDKLGEFNSSFAGNGNYKVSENTTFDLVLTPNNKNINSEIQIKKVSVYSMGQEESAPVKDSGLYKEIIAKVNLAL